MLSASASNARSDHASFYSWDGSFLRSVPASGNSLASVDGHYFVRFAAPDAGQLWSSSGKLIRAFTEPTLQQGSTSLNWAADGDYFCGLEAHGAGYALVAEDVAGKVQHVALDVPADVVSPDGLRSMSIQCSLTANRALVFGAFSSNGLYSHTQAALMSLPDGRPVRDFQLDMGFRGFGSPDLRWLIATSTDRSGSHTEVVDLADGTIQATLDGYFVFTPDGNRLVGTDGQGAAAIVDWRAKTELWRGPGHLAEVMARSDPSTNKMLLWLSTGWPQAGTDTFDYWIVDGSGTSLRFNPRGCVPIEASPARLCWSL